MSPGGVHFHRDDYPATLPLVAEVARYRTQLGYQPTPEGAYIDWAVLGERLSATDRAALLIAEGCALFEGHGGAPLHLRDTVVRAVEGAV